MSTPVLQMRAIDKRFGDTQALDAVDFRLLPGEVHALMGENGAGKSTLMKVLTGVYFPDAGEIELHGKRVEFAHPLEAQRAGVSTVYQEVNLCPNLSVAENISIGREPRRFGHIQWREVRRRASAALERVGVDIDVRAPLGGQSLAIQQMVAIARAIDISADVLILDEPTSSLDQDEVEQLFTLIRGLEERGIAVVFISHFLEQVYEIADRITVLRNGRLVGEWETGELPRSELVSKMLGRELETLEELDRHQRRERRDGETAPPVIEAKAVSRKRAIAPFDLAINAGEVVGLAGLLGSGRTEVARLLFGADRVDSGRLFIDGAPVTVRSPRATTRRGIAFCPENRRTEGLVDELTVRENIILALQAGRGWTRPIPRRRQDELVAKWIAALDVRPADPEPGRRDTQRRQPAEGPARPVAPHRAAAADPRRADARDRRRREDRGAAARAVALRRRRVGPVRLRRARGGAAAERPDRRAARPARHRGDRERRRRDGRPARPHDRGRGAGVSAGLRRLSWPLLAIGALLLVDLFFGHAFFALRMQDGHLYGNLVDILRFGAPPMLVALGMTIVIATGGIDLSVGALVAISGATACVLISHLGNQNSVPGVLGAIAVALALTTALGMWNGMLVAVVGIQPIVATLILMVAGRGIAQLITGGQIVTINSSPYNLIGNGYWLALPFALYIVAAMYGLSAALPRRSALGLLIESVGGNAEASRLAGVRSRNLIILAYAFSRAVLGDRRPHRQLGDQGRRRQQRRALVRARRDPRRRDRRDGAPRRPLLPRRHARRGAAHPDADHDHLLDRRPAGDHAALQGPRRDARLPRPVAGVPRQAAPAAPPPSGEHRRPPAARRPAPRASRGRPRMTTVESARDRLGASTRRLPVRYVPVLVTLSLVVAMFTAGSLHYPYFGTGQVFLNLFVDNSFLLVAVVGMTFVILTGGIDLSVGSVVALSTLLCAELAGHGWPAYAAFPVVLLVGATLGLSMGSIIHYFEIQPFIVTLAGMFLARGLCYAITVDAISITNPSFTRIAGYSLALPWELFLTMGAVVSLVVVAIGLYFLHLTSFGRTVYAIGGNRQSAVLMGLPVARTEVARLHDQRHVLRPRRDPALVLHAVRVGEPGGRDGARRDRRRRHRGHAPHRGHRATSSARSSAFSCSASSRR